MNKLFIKLYESELFRFAREAHEARFPAFAWKTTACDVMSLPVGTRPTVGQMVGQRYTWSHLWLNMTLRFEPMTTVRWAEYLENQEESIFNALSYLGSTPDRIEQNLKLMGVVGDGMESCDCPMAHFFHGVYGAWFADISRVNSQVDFVTCDNPGQVAQFIQEFDGEKRPEVDLFPDRLAIL
jgi:hypothetical protein